MRPSWTSHVRQTAKSAGVSTSITGKSICCWITKASLGRRIFFPIYCSSSLKFSLTFASRCFAVSLKIVSSALTTIALPVSSQFCRVAQANHASYPGGGRKKTSSFLRTYTPQRPQRICSPHPMLLILTPSAGPSPQMAQSSGVLGCQSPNSSSPFAAGLFRASPQ